MRRSGRFLTLLPLVGGCAFLPASMKQVLPAGGQNLSAAIPPGAGIEGKAGRLQDSLRSRLEWLAPQLAKDGPLLERLAFAPGADTSVTVAASFTDANGWNTHGKTPQDIACLELARWRKVGKTWPGRRKEAGLAGWPLQVRIAYRGHDVQRGRSDWAWDTLGLELVDSVRWTRGGEPLLCPATR